MQQESVKDAYSEFMFALKRLKILKAQMLELQKSITNVTLNSSA